MSTFDQEEQLKQELNNLLTEIVKTNPYDLVRTEALGQQFNFEKGLPYFERMLKLYKDLHDADLDNVPKNILENLKQHATVVHDHINKILSFNAAAENTPVNARDALINWFINNYPPHFQTIHPIISYSIRKGTDFEALQKQAKDILINIEATKNEIINRLEQAEKEGQSTLDKLKQAAAEVGVAQHSFHFKNETKYHDDESKKWLLITIFVGLLTIGWSYLSVRYHLFPVTDDPSIIELIQSFTSKLIILSVLYYVLIWSARNFNAHRHNYVINKHRCNALSTFEAFVKATDNDSDTKNAVLLQATQCIFNPQASGYLSKEVEHDSSSKVIEILRSAGNMSPKQ